MGENIQLENGTIFIADKPICGVCEEIEYITESCSNERPFYNLNTSVTITGTAHFNNDALAELLGITAEVKRLCKNRKVIHLARCGKKRTRKKNLHRMFRMLEKEVAKANEKGGAE